MAKPQFEEQIREVEKAIEQYPDLRFCLALQKSVLESQRDLRMSVTLAVNADVSEPAYVRELEKRACASGTPMIRHVETSLVDKSKMQATALRIVDGLIREGVQGPLGSLRTKLVLRSLKAEDLVATIVKGDNDQIFDVASSLELDSHLLIFLGHVLTQPLLEQIASMVDSSFLEKWWRPICPVCGVKPIVEREVEGRRFMICTLCGVRYPFESFLCVHCGNKDPHSLKSLMPEDCSAFRVDYCEKCRHFTKVIVDLRLKRRIPSGLEDLLTYHLDMIAEDAGLIRDWPPTAQPQGGSTALDAVQ